MPPTKQEISLLINPLVPESVQHNNRVRSPKPFYLPHQPKPKPKLSLTKTKTKQILTTLHSLTSFLLGLSAGILALQSSTGFLFYFAGTVVVSAFFHLLLVYRSGGKGAGVFFPGSGGGEIEGVDAKGWIQNGHTGNGNGNGMTALRKGAWKDVWFGGGVFGEALSGFVLGWAGVGGVLR